jgi:tetratricopeptide (TPR) repeat protein
MTFTVAGVRWMLYLAAALGATAPGAAQRIKLSVPLADLEHRAQVDSNDPAAQYNLALGLWNDKRFDEAEKALRLAVLLEPRFAEAHLALAYLPFARRPKLWTEVFRHDVPIDQTAVLEQSDREYRLAFLIDPMVDLRIIAAVTPSSPDFLDVKDYLGEAYALFIQGFADCEQGKYEDCHGRFTALIRQLNGEAHPDRVPNSVLWYKGIAAAHLGKYEIAADHFRTLIRRDLDFEKEREAKGEFSRVPLRINEYRYTLATILQASGKDAEAISTYHEVLAADLGLYMGHVRLAGMYEAQRDYPHALTERVDAANANPDDPSLLLDLGVTLGKAGMMAQAEEKLAQAIEANPRDSRPYFWIGIAQMEQGKNDQAKASFTQFLALAPSRYERQIAMAKDRLSKLH